MEVVVEKVLIEVRAILLLHFYYEIVIKRVFYLQLGLLF